MNNDPLKKFSDLKGRVDIGNLVLHRAIANKDAELVKKVLHSMNIDMTQCNDQGASPIDLIHQMQDPYLILLCYIAWINQFVASYNQNTPQEKRWNKQYFHSPLFNEMLETIYTILKCGYRKEIDFKERKETKEIKDIKEIKEVSKFLTKEEEKVIEARLYFILFNSNIHDVQPHMVYRLIEVTLGFGCTPLLCLAEQGQTDMMACFLKNGLSKINEKEFYTKKTALHVGAERGYLEMVRMLLLHGSEINERCNEYKNPLYYAVKNDHLEIVKLLLKHGTSIDAPTEYEETPLQWAQRRNKKAVHLLKAATDLLELASERALKYSGQYSELTKILEILGDSLNARKSKSGDTALLIAIQTGNEVIVKLLLERGGNHVLAAKNREGRTPLHQAVISKQINCVDMLLNKGANINATDNYDTPLSLSVKEEQPTMVRFLLKRGVKINLPFKDGKTILQKISSRQDKTVLPLLEAATLLLKLAENNQFDLKVLEAICDTLGDALNAVNNDGNSALHFTFFNKNMKFYQFLLKRGANIYSKNDKNEMPMNQEFQTKQGVNLLYSLIGKITQCNFGICDYKININREHSEMNDAFAIIMKTLPKVNETKETKESKEDTEHLSAIYQAEIKDELKRIIFRYGDLRLSFLKNFYEILQFISPEGDTPLLFAAAQGKTEIVKYLLDKHSSSAQKNHLGRTLLLSAASSGEVGLVQYLLEKKICTMYDMDNQGNHILHIATLSNAVGLLKYILNYDPAYLNVPNKKGHTALMLALMLDRVEVVELLFKFGAELKAMGDHGKTNEQQRSNERSLKLFEAAKALFEMVEKNSKESAESLFKILGEGLNAGIDTDNNAALHIAAKNGNSSWVSELLKRGANPILRNRNNDTPIHLAAFYGHVQCVKLLFPCSELDFKNRQSNVPLELAIQGEHIEVVRLFFSMGASIDSMMRGSIHSLAGFDKPMFQAIREVCKNNTTFPLLDAAIRLFTLKGDVRVEEVYEIFKLLGEGVNFRGPLLNTSLHEIVKKRCLPLVKFLVQHGAKNLENSEGDTPLILAAGKGCTDIIEYLLDSGFSNTAERNIWGRSALHHALFDNRDKAIKCLLKRGIKIDPQFYGKISPALMGLTEKQLELIPLENIKDTLQLLKEATELLSLSERTVQAGDKIVFSALGDALNGQRSTDGNTALHIAFEKGNILLVKELLKMGACIHIKNDQNQSPIHHFQDLQHKNFINAWIYIGKLGQIIFEINKDEKFVSESKISLLDEVCEELLKILDSMFKSEDCKEVKELKESKDKKETKESMVRWDAKQEILNEVRNIIFNKKIHAWIPKTVFRLLKSMNVDEKTRKYTPFMFAASHGQEDIMECFLEKGFSKITEDIEGNTALHIAVLYGQKNIIQYFLRKNPSLLKERNNSGFSLLHIASMAGKNNIIHYLLENKYSDVSEVDNFGNNALHIAAAHGQDSTVNELLAKKLFKIIDKNQDGRTALHIAACFGYNEVIKKLILQDENDNTLISGRQIAYPQMVYPGRRFEFIEQHCTELSTTLTDTDRVRLNFNETDKFGLTPLHLSVMNNKEETVKLFLRYGVELDPQIQATEHNAKIALILNAARTLLQVGEQGSTPTELNNATKVLDLALNAREKKNGNTALHFASALGNTYALKILLESKANTTLKNHEGNTPLLLAVAQGNALAVDELTNIKKLINRNLELKKDITSEIDSNGNNILHIAAYHGHLNIIKYILSEKLIPVNAVNAACCTALHIAAAKNDIKILQELIMHGADSSLLDKEFKRNALDYAIANGHYEALCCLLKHGGYIDSEGHKNAVNRLQQTEQPSKTKILALLQSCHKLMEIAENNSKESAEGLVKLLADGLLNGRQYKNINKVSNSLQFLDGNTALHWSVKNKNIKLTKLLLDNGATLNIQNHDGETALHLAVMFDFREMVEELFKRGADCEIYNKSGHSVLRLAVVMNRLDIVKLLLKFGINFRLNYPDRKSLDSLSISKEMSALLMNVIDFLRWSSREPIAIDVQPRNGLSKLGDALNARGIEDKTPSELALRGKLCYENGNTALHNLLSWKMCPNRMHAIKMLLDAGASMVIQNHAGKTPFDLALKTKNPYLIATFYFSEIKQYGLTIEKDPNSPINVERIQQRLKALLEIIHKEYPQNECSKEVKRRKEAREEIVIESLSIDNKNELCFELGNVLSQYRTKAWEPHMAYECLFKIDRNYTYYPKANGVMYEMLIGRHVVIEPAQQVQDNNVAAEFSGKMSESHEHQELHFRTAIQHLLESDSTQLTIFGNLVLDYFNMADSIRGIKGVTGRNEISFVALLEYLRDTVKNFSDTKVTNEKMMFMFQQERNKFEEKVKAQQEKLRALEVQQDTVRNEARQRQQKLKESIERLKTKLKQK